MEGVVVEKATARVAFEEEKRTGRKGQSIIEQRDQVFFECLC